MLATVWSYFSFPTPSGADALNKYKQNSQLCHLIITDYSMPQMTGVELAGVSFDTMVASYLLEAGERSLRRAVELAPNEGVTHANIAALLISTGRDEEAIAAAIPAQSFGKPECIAVHLTLVNQALFTLMYEFNGIFQGQNMAIFAIIFVIYHCRQRR